MKTRRPPAEGAVTRAALVEAAEELFSIYGFDGVSIRQINSHAGLAPSSAHYHFGSKEGILEAVVGRVRPEVQGVVEEQLSRLTASDEKPTVREIVEVYAAPYIELLHADPVRGSRWIKVISMLTPEDREIYGSDVIMESQVNLIHRIYPNLTAHRIETRIVLASYSLLSSLCFTPTGQTPQDRRARGRFTDLVVDYVASGLEGTLNSATGES